LPVAIFCVIDQVRGSITLTLASRELSTKIGLTVCAVVANAITHKPKERAKKQIIDFI